MDNDAETLFNRRFLAYFAVGIFVASFIYIGCITFMEVPEKNQRFADTVLGFLLGTLLGTLITFFYGSSKSSQAKDQTIKDMTPQQPLGTTPTGKPDDPVSVVTEPVAIPSTVKAEP